MANKYLVPSLMAMRLHPIGHGTHGIALIK